MYCQKCGSALKEGNRFCEGCGTQIGEQSTAAMPAMPVTGDLPVLEETPPEIPAVPDPDPVPADTAPPQPPPAPSYTSPYGTPPAPPAAQSPYTPPYGQPAQAPPSYAAPPVYAPPSPPPQPYGGYARPNPPAYGGDDPSPLGTGAFLGYMLLFSIPFVGFILQLVFAFGQGNVNRKNFARANLLIWLISVGLVVVVYILVIAIAGSAFLSSLPSNW
ncbi:MAG: zinc ribbon domain-containing protein [Oscillospiraceae bacterium]|nr:zinc ribbon domain-containing protein [Oscillospiraceae bacterium]